MIQFEMTLREMVYCKILPVPILKENAKLDKSLISHIKKIRDIKTQKKNYSR